MKRFDPTYYAVQQYVRALPCREYLIRLIKEEEGNKYAQQRSFTASELLKSIGALKSYNCDGFNIYARPKSIQYLLGDDITPSQLPFVRKLAPSLIMETSPENYQVFLRLEDMPENEAAATQLCRLFARQYQADLGSADALHVGRLPGFTNRKPKHQQPGGLYPFVKVAYAQPQASSFSPPKGGLCLSDPLEIKDEIPKGKLPGRDRSREDFAIACRMIREGATDEEIFMVLSKREKGRHRPRYIRLTIRNARRAVGRS